MDVNELIANAKIARNYSHSPYSNTSTGAALLTSSGKVYLGCNVENHGLMSVCAERTAFLKAISEGEKDFESIAVVIGEHGKEAKGVTPCGYCRQFMSEFVKPDFKIYTLAQEGDIIEYKMNELLPHGFIF